MPPASENTRTRLLVVHERLRFREIGGRRAVLDGEARHSVGARLAHDATRAACDFRDHFRSKTLNDLVERAMDGRH